MIHILIKAFHGKSFPVRGAYVMSRKKDLTGMRFGKLTAVESTSERKNGYTIWICKCDCGNIVRVPSRFLKNSWSSFCGCEGKKEAFEDLTGKRFGKLKVISRREERDDHRRILWNCVCDCGNTIIAPCGQLRNGYRRSSGHRRSPAEWPGSFWTQTKDYMYTNL